MLEEFVESGLMVRDRKRADCSRSLGADVAYFNAYELTPQALIRAARSGLIPHFIWRQRFLEMWCDSFSVPGIPLGMTYY